MKLLYALIILFSFCACKQERQIKKATKKELAEINAQFKKEVNKMEYDSLNTNRVNILNKLRTDLSYHCISLANVDFFYVILKVNFSGEAESIAVLDKEGLNKDKVDACVMTFFEDNDVDFGLMRDLITTEKDETAELKTYSVRVY